MARLAGPLSLLGIMASCFWTPGAFAQALPAPSDAPTLGVAGDFEDGALQWSDARWIAVRGADHTLLVDPITLEERLRLDAPPQGALAFAPQGNLAAYVSVEETQNKREAHLWLFDLATGRAIAELPGHEDGVTALAFSADGRWLGSGDRAGRAIVWSVAKRRPVLRLPPHVSQVDDIAFSADGKQVVTRAAYTVWRWNIADGTFLGNTYLHFESDNRRPWVASNLATGLVSWPLAGGKIQLSRLDGARLKELRQIGVDFETQVARFSRGGGQLMAISNERLALWDVASGSEISARFELADAALKPDGSEVIMMGRRGLAVSKVEALKSAAPQGVCGMDISPDGKIVAAGGSDNTLVLWNAVSGELLSRVKTADGAPCPVQFAPNGRALISGTSSGLRIHDPLTGREVRRIEGDLNAWSFKFSPQNPKELITLRKLAKGREIVAVDVERGGVRVLAGPRGKLDSAELSPDGSRLLTTDGPSVSLWDAVTGKKTLSFRAAGRIDELSFVTSSLLVGIVAGKIVRFDATGREIDSTRPAGMADGDEMLVPGLQGATVAYRVNDVLHVWDVASKRDRGVVEGRECFGRVGSDGKSVVALCDGSVRVNALDSPTSATRIMGPRWRYAPLARFASVSSVAFSPDGSKLAISGTDDALRIWHLDSGRLELQSGKADASEQIAWSPDGAQFAVGLNWDQAALRDPVSGRLLKLLDAEPTLKDSGRILRLSVSGQTLDAPLAFGNNGKSLVYAVHGRTIQWDLASGRIIGKRSEQPDAISPDGEWLAFLTAPDPNARRVSKPERYRLRLVSVRTGQTRTFPLRALEARSWAHARAAFSHDGSQVAVSSGDSIVLVEAKSGRLRATLNAQGDVLGAAFSPEGSRLVVGTSRGALVFDVASAKPISELEYQSSDPGSAIMDEGGFGRATFHPSGKFVVLAGTRGVTLWSPQTNEPVLELRLFESQDAGLLQTRDATRVELFGSGAADARKLLTCRKGVRVLPFEACAATLEKHGLLATL